jgi:hypothetical protein
MRTYKTQAEVEKDIKDGVLTIEGDVRFECSISIGASIVVRAGNITARDINAEDINAGDINACGINARDINACGINAWNITARDINACGINAWNIKAGDINAWNITAGDINARDINAWDINAGDINAWNILYSAFCGVYNSIKCTSIKAEREKHSEPICLDGELTVKPKEDDEITKAIALLSEKGKLKDGKILI